MRLRITFLDYDTGPTRTIMPNAVAVVDEYMEDEHGQIPDFYVDEVERLRNENPGRELREAFIEISDAAVVALFDPPTIVGATTPVPAPPAASSERVLIGSDYYNAHYLDGRLVRQGKPDVLNLETLAREYPDAAIYTVDENLYDKVLDGEGYPDSLGNFPLDECEQAR